MKKTKKKKDKNKKIIKNKNVEPVKKENPVKKIFTYFLVSRILLLIIMFLAEYIISNSDYSEYDDVLLLFDNIHYLNIAKYGYKFEYLYAFFPLTSLLIRYLGKVGFIILNQVLVLGSSYLLYLLGKEHFKCENPYYPPLLFLISPIAVFTCMFYSETLFIFLTILAFYLYKTKKSYLGLGIAMGLSVCARNLGSTLFFSIFICMFIEFIKKKEKFKNILITYIPATIISCLYPIFLYFKTGNPLYFVEVQFEYWERVGTNIFMLFIDAGKYVFGDCNISCIMDYFFVLFIFIYIFVYIIKNRKEKSYWGMFLYLILTLVAISSTIRENNTALVSIYRYIFCCFPVFFMVKERNITTIFFIAMTGFVSFMFLLGVHFY